MRSLFVSAALALMVGGATAAAQTPSPASSPASPQPPAPPGQAQPSNVTLPTISAFPFGPINATGTNGAYVSAEATGRPAVYLGSDASFYGIVGTFTNHPLGFRTNNIARMFIDLSGNVGIGTPMPGYKLDVSGDANISGTYRVNGVPISATSNWTQAGNAINYTIGNVGIGTPTPAHALEVNGTASFGAPGGVYGYSVAGAYPTLGFNAFYTNSGYLAGVGGYGGVLQFQDSDGLFGYYTSYSVAAGEPHVFTPRFVITSNGRVGIGTTTPVGSLDVESDGHAVIAGSTGGAGVLAHSSTYYGVWGTSDATSYAGVLGTNNSNGSGVSGYSSSGTGVNGSSNTGWAGSFQGKVSVTGCVSAANLACASDARLKQDITPLSYGLREVLQLRPVRWQWKDTTTTQLNLGLIAQDVEPVLPELILHNVDTKGSLGLNYFGFVPVLINAIQEQQGTITSLEARIRALEQALQRLLEPR